MIARARFAGCMLAAALALFGCHGGPPSPHIALVTTTAGLGDRSVNDAAAAGLRSCARSTHIPITIVTPASEDDVEGKIILAATQDRDPVITLGGGARRDVTWVARRFPKSHFDVIDGSAAEENVESISFNDEEGAYLAGALAAMMARHHRIGFIGGMREARVERSEAGFTAGARAVAARTQVVVRYLGSYIDRRAGRTVAEHLYDEGEDVLFAVAGPAGLGAIEASAHRAGAYAIGVDANQDALAPGHVLTSVVERVDRVAERICEEAAARKPMSGPLAVGLADGGITLTDFRYTRALIGPARLAKLAGLRDQIVAGTVHPPKARDAVARASVVPAP